MADIKAAYLACPIRQVVSRFGDIVACPIDVDADLQLTKMQLLDAILKEMSHEGFTETDADDFWDDMMDLRRAKNIR